MVLELTGTPESAPEMKSDDWPAKASLSQSVGCTSPEMLDVTTADLLRV